MTCFCLVLESFVSLTLDVSFILRIFLSSFDLELVLSLISYKSSVVYAKYYLCEYPSFLDLDKLSSPIRVISFNL